MGKRKRKQLRFIKKIYSDKEKQKEKFDSYLTGAYCRLHSKKYAHFVRSLNSPGTIESLPIFRLSLFFLSIPCIFLQDSLQLSLLQKIPQKIAELENIELDINVPN